jgi:hypothetical protein
MRSSFRCPTLHPMPQPFLYCDYEFDNEQSSIVHIGLCPFCLRKFKPIWNCNVVPCLHYYHSWCLLIHFLDSTMCIANGCKLEPCDKWWIAMDLTKRFLTVGTTPNLKWDLSILRWFPSLEWSLVCLSGMELYKTIFKGSTVGLRMQICTEYN